MKTIHSASALTVAATLAVLLASSTQGQSDKDVTIVQKDKEFSSAEVTIKPGEKIVFKNDDSVTHNVFSVSPANPFTIKVQPPGESSTVEFKDEGVTEVRCAIHPKMKVTVTVKK